MAYVEHHADAVFFAYGTFRKISTVFAVAAVCEDVRLQLRQFTTDGTIGVIRRVAGEHDFVDGAQTFYHFFALAFRHECVAFLGTEPVVIIQNHHELVAKLFCFIEHACVTNVHWIKPPRNGHPSGLFHGFPFGNQLFRHAPHYRGVRRSAQGHLAFFTQRSIAAKRK